MYNCILVPIPPPGLVPNMIPQTLPGFLMLFGLLMSAYAMISKHEAIEMVGTKLPKLHVRTRSVMLGWGAIMFVAGIILYSVDYVPAFSPTTLATPMPTLQLEPTLAAGSPTQATPTPEATFAPEVLDYLKNSWVAHFRNKCQATFLPFAAPGAGTVVRGSACRAGRNQIVYEFRLTNHSTKAVRIASPEISFFALNTNSRAGVSGSASIECASNPILTPGRSVRIFGDLSATLDPPGQLAGSYLALSIDGIGSWKGAISETPGCLPEVINRYPTAP